MAPEMNSRIDEFQKHCAGSGLKVLIYCTDRTLADQARLFRQGRKLAAIQAKADELSGKWGRPDLAEILLSVGPQRGQRVVTNAAPGQSGHNYGMAADGAPLVGGKPVWGTKEAEDLLMWRKYGLLALGAGLDWAGCWTAFREFPHVQMPGFDWREHIRGHKW